MESWLILHCTVELVVSVLHVDKASLMVRPEAVHPLHSNNPYEMHAGGGLHTKRLFVSGKWCC
jgi:hypothetical protein